MSKPKVTRFECPKADWIRVVNAARRTWGKKPIDHEPSDKFKRKILLAEHTPIRLLEYDFTIENIRQWVTVHLVRHHVGCEKFVHSQRQDINNEVEKMTARIIEIFRQEGMLREGWRERDYLQQGECNDMDMSCNAQAFKSISRKRLCKGCPSPETRQAWEIVIEALREVDPILAEKCVPDCVYCGFCTETDRCCGYVNTPKYQEHLREYRKVE
ncbi:MAG: FAD-dependent thymidylate synthase [Bacteroidales bacterium]|nr:FAD-dependent thymidylate synthase [Bacteroidales bacterium]